MRVSLIETDTAWEDPAANRNRIRENLPASGDLSVFPELSFSGFTMQPEPDPEAEPFLQDLARERGTAIVAGYVADGPRNRAVAVDARGEVLARYDKLHPFSYAGEHESYVPGNELPIFELSGIRTALLICYDLRFPGPFREAALRGAQLFCVIASWPAARVDAWRTLLRARAFENQAYVIGVNRVGADPQAEYVSSSRAVAPDGEVLCDGPGTVEVDGARVDQLRATFPLLSDVRGDRYRYGEWAGSPEPGAVR
ncbi:MAG: nitrilase-related carbon-nitrogen hydrolase [Planctomycetota bacterium]